MALDQDVPCRYACGRLFDTNQGRSAHEKAVHKFVWTDKKNKLYGAAQGNAPTVSEVFVSTADKIDDVLRGIQQRKIALTAKVDELHAFVEQLNRLEQEENILLEAKASLNQDPSMLGKTVAR